MIILGSVFTDAASVCEPLVIDDKKILIGIFLCPSDWFWMIWVSSGDLLGFIARKVIEMLHTFLA